MANAPQVIPSLEDTQGEILRNTTKSAILGLFVLAAFSMTGAAVDQNATEDASVDVTVESTVAVDVHPTNLAFTDGSVGSQDLASDGGFTAVDLLNTGSTYVDRVWVNTSTPSADPFGTGSAGNYDAGNFFQIKPNNASTLLSGDSNAYHYVNRVEYIHNTTQKDEVPSYITVGQVGGQGYGDSDEGAFVGRFRAGEEAYHFVLVSGSPGSAQCDGSGTGDAILRVADTPQTDSEVGTTDFSDDGSDYTQYNITDSAGSFGIADEVPTGQSGVTLALNTNQGSVTREYTVLTACGANTPVPQVIRTRYNVEAGDATDLTSSADRAEFLLSGDTETTQLEPGSVVTFDTGVEIPRGVAAGSVQTGDITFAISADGGTSTS